MKKTKIECFTHSWNPIDGCKFNCRYCFAKILAKRLGGHKGLAYYMAQEKHNETGENHVLIEPMRDAATGRAEAYPFGFDPTFCAYRLLEPMGNKVPANIIVCSMGDMFGPWVPDSWITEVFNAATVANWHNYLFLSKNPLRYKSFSKCPDNFFFGATIDDRKSLNALTQDLPENLRFISIEPIQEMLRFGETIEKLSSHLEWVIIGTENGNIPGKVLPKAEWIEDVSEACKRFKIPLFMKRGQKSKDGTCILEVFCGKEFRQEYPKRLEANLLGQDVSA